jgi:ABC-2 type transport system permease protein
MLDSLYRIVALTRKELLAILKDPRSRFSIIVPPILQCLIYGYVATYDLNHVPYAAFDRDRSAASQQLLARIDGSGVFQRVANLDRDVDIKTFIDNKRALLVIQIDRDFERWLLSDMPGAVQIIADGRNSNTAGTAIGYVNDIVDGFNTDWRNSRGQPGAPIKITTRAWYNPNLETRWHMIPALIGTLTLIQTLLLTGLSVAREREQGTFDQLLVTPFRPAEIMAGKALPAILVGIVQATLGFASRATLVSYSVCRFVCHALRRARRVPARCDRYRTAVVVGCGDHAASHAIFFSTDHALFAVIRFDHADQ